MGELLVSDWVTQNAQRDAWTCDFDFDDVALPEEFGWSTRHADARGGAGEDDGTGQEGGSSREVGDEGSDGEHHLRCRGVLLDDAVDAADDTQGAGICDAGSGRDVRSDGAEGVEGLAPAELPAGAFFLPPASGHVVGARKANDTIEGAFEGDIAEGSRPEDDGELGLEVDLGSVLADAGDGDGVSRKAERGRVFGEDHGAFWDGCALLLCVLGVIAADADDVSEWEGLAALENDRGAERGFDDVQVRQRGAP